MPPDFAESLPPSVKDLLTIAREILGKVGSATDRRSGK
jgi:hypothetical protein